MGPSIYDSPGAGELPEHVFRQIIDRTAFPFVVIERDGTIRYASGSVWRLGWRAADLIGHNMVEYVHEESLQLAVEAVLEIERSDHQGAGVPMVFRLVDRPGWPSWVEVGAIPLVHDDDVEAIAIRLRPWDGQERFDGFLDALLADQPLPVVLEQLASSIASSLECVGVAIHHGFDGEHFSGVAASPGVPPGCAVPDGPWVDALGAEGPCSFEPKELPAPVAAAADAAGLQACWAAPVPISEGLAPAVIVGWRARAGPPLIGHRSVLGRSCRYVQLALVRTAEHEQLRHLAGHDALTGVANRAQFRDALASALAIGERHLAVAFCDLDGFKAVNDAFGHRSGDAVLVEVVDRLRRHLRTGDELARMGGDEFTVLLRNVTDADAARQVVVRLMGALEDPFALPEGTVHLGLSVGVALAEAGVSADALLARADDALYAVKLEGGRGVRVIA